jgi:hypothetical protein
MDKKQFLNNTKWVGTWPLVSDEGTPIQGLYYTIELDKRGLPILKMCNEKQSINPAFYPIEVLSDGSLKYSTGPSTHTIVTLDSAADMITVESITLNPAGQIVRKNERVLKRAPPE